MRQYGPRDAVSVLHSRGRRVSLRDALVSTAGGWMLDGKHVSYAQLEDEAERYEPLKARITPRG